MPVALKVLGYAALLQFILLTIAVVMVVVGEASTPTTAAAAWTYLAALVL